MNGIISIYKPSGITSHDVVSRVRRITGVKRVGHAGTLDPMATGVLPVLVGSACSAQDYIMEHDKVYVAGIRLGIMTDTGDITGNILETTENIPGENDVKRVGESFVGELLQIPPMYSAIKIDGKKLYDLAREGKTVEREGRQITVYSSEMIEKVNDRDYYFRFSVSKGTYIRTLAEDIGKALGCAGTLFSLERTVCGAFTKENSILLLQLEDVLEKDGRDGVEKLLIPTEQSFFDLPVVKLSEFYSRLCKNGVEIYLDKARISTTLFNEKGMCRLYDSDGMFFAVGQRGNYQDGEAVKAKIRFDTVRK